MRRGVPRLWWSLVLVTEMGKKVKKPGDISEGDRYTFTPEERAEAVTAENPTPAAETAPVRTGPSRVLFPAQTPRLNRQTLRKRVSLHQVLRVLQVAHLRRIRRL